MNEQKIKGLIGIAKKAGKITSGAEQTLESVRNAKKNKGVKLLLCSADASQNTLKRIRNCSEFYGIPMGILSIDKNELAHITGHSGELSVVGVADAGFAKAISENLSDSKQ